MVVNVRLYSKERRTAHEITNQSRDSVTRGIPGIDTNFMIYLEVEILGRLGMAGAPPVCLL